VAPGADVVDFLSDRALLMLFTVNSKDLSMGLFMTGTGCVGCTGCAAGRARGLVSMKVRPPSVPVSRNAAKAVIARVFLVRLARRKGCVGTYCVVNAALSSGSYGIGGVWFERGVFEHRSH